MEKKRRGGEKIVRLFGYERARNLSLLSCQNLRANQEERPFATVHRVRTCV